MTSLETTPQMKICLSERMLVIAGSLTAVGLVISGFILFGINFVINTSAMAFALYASLSIVVETEEKSKKLLSIVVVSALYFLLSELAFSFLQQFVALCVSLGALLVLTKFALIKDHDSGWFGALCGVVLSLFFLLMVELILVIGRLLLT
jgi:hypothetical protein